MPAEPSRPDLATAVPHPGAETSTARPAPRPRNRRLLVALVGLLALAAPFAGWYGAKWWVSPRGGSASVPGRPMVVHGGGLPSPRTSPRSPAGGFTAGSPHPAGGVPDAGAAGTHSGDKSKPASPSGPSAQPNPGHVDLARNGSASASSSEGGHLDAAKAIDGDQSTRWGSAFSDPQWLMVDLGKTFQISKVTLYWQRSHATAYRVELSVDGQNWTTVYQTGTGQGGTVTIGVNKAAARYVRMYGTARSGQYGYSLFEMDVR